LTLTIPDHSTKHWWKSRKGDDGFEPKLSTTFWSSAIRMSQTYNWLAQVYVVSTYIPHWTLYLIIVYTINKLINNTSVNTVIFDGRSEAACYIEEEHTSDKDMSFLRQLVGGVWRKHNSFLPKTITFTGQKRHLPYCSVDTNLGKAQLSPDFHIRFSKLLARILGKDEKVIMSQFVCFLALFSWHKNRQANKFTFMKK